MAAHAPATVRPATPADDDGITALWSAAFDAPLMVPLWTLDPDRHAHTLVVTEADGTVSASVYCLPRTIRNHQGGVDLVAGLANVATLPIARGRGYVRLLLAAFADLAQQIEADWALLFTGTPGVYSGSGWTLVPQRYRVGALAAEAAAPRASTTPVRTGTFDEWPALAPLHERSAARHPLATVRSAADWQRTALWHRGSTLLVATEDDAPVGYLVLDLSGDEAVVAELAASASDDAVAQALTGHACTLASAAGLDRMLLRIGDGSQTERLALTFLTDVSWREDRTAMTFPVNASESAVSATVLSPDAYHSTGDYL